MLIKFTNGEATTEKVAEAQHLINIGKAEHIPQAIEVIRDEMIREGIWPGLELV